MLKYPSLSQLLTMVCRIIILASFQSNPASSLIETHTTSTTPSFPVGKTELFSDESKKNLQSFCRTIFLLGQYETKSQLYLSRIGVKKGGF
jgi:hypothetical protein